MFIGLVVVFIGTLLIALVQCECVDCFLLICCFIEFACLLVWLVFLFLCFIEFVCLLVWLVCLLVCS